MSTFRPLSFEEALPRLIHTYNKGKLVPFIGSGLSMPAVPGWGEFIRRLSLYVGSDASEEQATTPQALIQHAEKCVTALQRQGQARFIEAVQKSLGYHPSQVAPAPTEQCASLAKIWWPLVLTTNYDTMFTKAYQEAHTNRNMDGAPLSIFGRNQLDCHTLLSALNAPSNTAYWALQGYFEVVHLGRTV